MYDWFSGLKLHHFWEPITASHTADWRRTHIVAHVLGGMVWDALAHVILLGHGTTIWVNLSTSALLRVLAVGLWQATGWEAVQHENWRPELTTPPGKPGTGYPWLSAGWDTACAVLGAALLELALVWAAVL